jgi:hypothetical protein
MTVPNTVCRPQSQTISPPDSPKFNPNAPSFVPSQHASPGFPWDAFLAGTTTASANQQAMYAQKLVAHLPSTCSEPRGELPGQIFNQLANSFCQQAGSPESNGITVADFAKAVRTELRNNPAHGKWAADNFSWHMKERLYQTFLHAWNLVIRPSHYFLYSPWS